MSKCDVVVIIYEEFQNKSQNFILRFVLNLLHSFLLCL